SNTSFCCHAWRARARGPWSRRWRLIGSTMKRSPDRPSLLSSFSSSRQTPLDELPVGIGKASPPSNIVRSPIKPNRDDVLRKCSATCNEDFIF
ncbi:MAG: hypothetical protein ACH346_07575, partial [Chthoniobacterales bacterium]